MLPEAPRLGADVPSQVLTVTPKALAATSHSLGTSSIVNQTEESFGLFSLPVPAQRVHTFADPEIDELPVVQSSSLNSSGVGSLEKLNHDFQNYELAREILFTKWKESKHTPASFTSDLDELARYIAGQPGALDLLVSLKQEPLRIAYAPLEFRSVVKGTAFHVRSVTIYFDPRASAVLRQNRACVDAPGLCKASAADAFIHELIHASIALCETASFIESGAMNSIVYPYAHEREVLKRERDLYQMMTLHDHQPRPQRHRHLGQLRAAACVTCL